jgi:chromate transporter
MEREVVGRRRWLTRDEFLDYVGATNLIPGPNSTELAIHIGMARHGWAGLLVAGCCFILPAALLVGGIAWAYVRYGALPDVAGILRGIVPVVIAVIASALWQLGRTALKSAGLAVLGLGALAALLAGVHELIVLLVAGLASALSAGGMPWSRRIAVMAGIAGGWTWSAGLAAAAAAGAGRAGALSLWPLFLVCCFWWFLVFARIGSVLFGSGYVLIAFLRADVVERLGWITEQQLLDAIAVGQVTPGPLFTTATFVGYLVGGVAGAAVATAGIFLPAFVFVALSGPLVPRLRRSRVAGAVLDGVNVASLALMAAVTLQLSVTTLRAPVPLALAGLSLVLLSRYRASPTWLVAGGAAVGWILERTS